MKADLTMLPAVYQEHVIRKFLPSELIPADWSCQERSFIENIQSLYETGNIKIQMYGSPEIMEKYLMDFMNFPGHEQFFQFDDSLFYKNNLPTFKSLGGKVHIYKKDIYEMLFEYIPNMNTLPPLQKLARNLISYYLKSLKRKLTNSHEMIFIHEGFERKLSNRKKILEKILGTGKWKERRASSGLDPQDTHSLLDGIDVIFKGTGMSQGMRKMVTMVTKEVPVTENLSEYADMLTWLFITINNFEQFISENKIMMFSRSETVHLFTALKIKVRLFESNREKVVMSHELLHAIRIENLNVSGFEDKILAMPKLSAMSLHEVFQIIPSNICKMLEFIRVPLRNITRNPNIIPTIDGSYCLSAYQFLLLTLCDAVLVKKIFQGMKKDQWPRIMEEFYTILVDTLRDGNYFISYEKYEDVKLMIGTWFKKNFPSPNQKEISRAHKNGFTCEDLKNQIERLELSEIFPDIGEFAFKTSKIRPTNGCPYEATNQMLHLIQETQFSYVFSFLSKQLIAVFHERKWCVEFLPNCPFCSEEQNNGPSMKTAEDSSVSVQCCEESKAVEEKKDLTEIAVNSSDIPSSEEVLKASSTEQSDGSNSESLSSSAPNKTVVLEKQEPVRKQKKPKKKMEKSNVKPEEKESQACPKCIRASEYTTKTNEKLRLSNIEVKHLKKQLSVVELALEEKNERIRMLEEKLREKEKQSNLKSSEVETLKTKNQELELKNNRNERLIATFSEVVSKKDTAIKSLQCQNYEKDKLMEQMVFEKSKAIISRSTEDSEKVDSLLSNLLETKRILSKEDPLEKSDDICKALAARTNSKVSLQMVKYETKVFQLQVSSYIQIVENNIRLIRGNQAIKVDQIFEIPDFPEFSEEFKNVHKSIMKKEAPLLCRQLLNLTDEIADMECVICLIEMESHDGTTKCANCKRRYHNHCIRSWLKKDSICPACKKGMVDEQEFPAL